MLFATLFAFNCNSVSNNVGDSLQPDVEPSSSSVASSESSSSSATDESSSSAVTPSSSSAASSPSSSSGAVAPSSSSAASSPSSSGAVPSSSSATTSPSSSAVVPSSSSAATSPSSSSDAAPSSSSSATSTNSGMTTKSALEYFRDEGVKAGWNLGNTLDAVNGSMATEGQWSWGGPGPATQALFAGVAQSGFDAVRIPVTWLGHIGSAPDYKISDARLQRVATVVGWVRDAGMKAIINVHHDGNYTDPPNTWGFLKFAEVGRGEASNDQVKEQFAKVWTQIANHFKDYGDFLIFETMNEVHSGNWGCSSGSACNTEQDRLFDWNQTALNAIRATGGNNAKRFVAVPGLGSTEPGTVIAAHNRQKLLPNDPGNGTDKLIVSVHFYAPWQYTVADITGQGGEGRHTITQTELNNIATEAGRIKTTFIDRGIAVYYGEWGAQTGTRSNMSQKIKEDHLDYMRRVATAASANGILPFVWDDGGNFKILERSNGRPAAGFATEVLNAIL